MPFSLRLASFNFNPRAPCGARLADFTASCRLMIFQSTRPVWGATHVFRAIIDILSISIHAPRVGRDPVYAVHSAAITAFQSTRPVWGATMRDTRYGRIVDDFNPRAPCGARRGSHFLTDKRAIISIHAPRVGRDALMRAIRAKLSFYFNPRAPCGARRSMTVKKSSPFLFQSTRPVWGATRGYRSSV